MPLLVRSEPYRDFDRLFQQFMGDSAHRPTPLAVPMDAYRKEDRFLLQFDLPGVDASAIELTVDNSTLTVKAERRLPQIAEGIEALVAERPHGTFSRQILLGDNLDTTQIDAKYADGVLTLSIPVAEEAKPRRVEVRHDFTRAEIHA
ncbi:MAG TPA: Hsp20/alpha crystallin family protein [Acidimicrobiales bacterium]|nr:Hsp20/alpha crystallin family protein [Acidimicrobiales bacterium]